MILLETHLPLKEQNFDIQGWNLCIRLTAQRLPYHSSTFRMLRMNEKLIATRYFRNGRKER
ncbi:hypothetical protein NQ317_006911 [Molorchus minor]|uniref:Uncharacterized protein n=1 Tax=Molorchus minor TaxID=1323400 RepID=A0ABQ9J673_9CUCU|nr:hypothetical protein NQ317_006911 [Molorchus minor]